jgi:hypothetical protein
MPTVSVVPSDSITTDPLVLILDILKGPSVVVSKFRELVG